MRRLMKVDPELRVGTSGWNYRHWRGRFYPPELPTREWFTHYSGAFDSVEINNTFYRLPGDGTFDAWRDQAPEGFCYAVKASRYITHLKRLKDVGEPLDRFLQGARRLESHLGPILYQLPPHWGPDVGRLREFCRQLPRDLTHVIEFREPKWLMDEVYEVLETHEVALCVHDLVDRHPRRVTGKSVYVRLHGAGQKYGGCYPMEQLQEWAEWLQRVAKDGRGVYTYFNNDREGHAVANAMSLRSLLGLAGATQRAAPAVKATAGRPAGRARRRPCDDRQLNIPEPPLA
jgi:uncharacterized protein YecE (DUF72 family)